MAIKSSKKAVCSLLNDAYDSERNESKSYKYLRMDKKLKKDMLHLKNLQTWKIQLSLKMNLEKDLLRNF